MLLEGLDGVGAAGVELEVAVHVGAEGLEGDAAVLRVDVLGRSGVDVGEHGLLVGGELLEGHARHVGGDDRGEAEGGGPAAARVRVEHGEGGRASGALQDPAGEGRLAGAVVGAVAADHLDAVLGLTLLVEGRVAVGDQGGREGGVALGELAREVGEGRAAAVEEVGLGVGGLHERREHGGLGLGQSGGPGSADEARGHGGLGRLEVEGPEVGVELLLRAREVQLHLLDELGVVLLHGVVALLALLGGVHALGDEVADDALVVPLVTLGGDVRAEVVPGEGRLARREVGPVVAGDGLDVLPVAHDCGGA